MNIYAIQKFGKPIRYYSNLSSLVDCFGCHCHDHTGFVYGEAASQSAKAEIIRLA
jgi:hypothetical protein